MRIFIAKCIRSDIYSCICKCVRASLMLSYSMRRDAIACIEIGGGTAVAVYGDRVKGLRPDEKSCKGFFRTAITKGFAQGVKVVGSCKEILRGFDESCVAVVTKDVDVEKIHNLIKKCDDVAIVIESDYPWVYIAIANVEMDRVLRLKS